MRDDALNRLAARAGIAVAWTDAADRPQHVQPDVLRRVLVALGLPCETPGDIAESERRITHMQSRMPFCVTAEASTPIVFNAPPGKALLISEDGARADVVLHDNGDGRSRLPAISRPGYYRLQSDDGQTTLAVAPRQCFSFAEIAPRGDLWGLAVQLYGLRRAGDGGIGDAAALKQLARSAASQGAAAIAISPTHALFAADPGKCSPYSPSNRLALNPLFADPDFLLGPERTDALIDAMGLRSQWAQLETKDLIDWPQAGAQRFALLRRLFDEFWVEQEEKINRPLVDDFLEFRQAGGVMLERHAQFEALHAEQIRIDPARANWRAWPADLRDPDQPGVAAFVAEHERELTYHVFLQWLADRSLASAQREARRAGMRIGLIADLAVGMENGGSQAWSQQHDVLVGLNVGAPPDLFNPHGQNWGLTTFSPHALAQGSFDGFLGILRTALRNAGGLRIDHIMGLMRLWLIPEGAAPTQGAYLAYPCDDLLRLVRLESWRNRAIVIGEDLGTVPEGFRATLATAAIAGMDLPWFTRDKAGDFLAPGKWRGSAIALTSTHDLPTVAGWWRGTDIDTRAQCGLMKDAEKSEAHRAREEDRSRLWHAFRAAGVTSSTEPKTENPAAAVGAMVKFVAATPAPLVLLTLEDALGLEQQPNLPGTIGEHPNWRRRYPVPADQIFDDDAASARARQLNERHSP